VQRYDINLSSLLGPWEDRRGKRLRDRVEARGDEARGRGKLERDVKRGKRR